MSNRTTAAASIAQLAADERGALAVEYLVVTMVGLIVAAALGGLGALMVDAYGSTLKVLYSEFP